LLLKGAAAGDLGQGGEEAWPECGPPDLLQQSLCWWTSLAEKAVQSLVVLI